MKLLFCTVCGDVRKLQGYAAGENPVVFCKCRQSFGRYEPDGLHATYGGQGRIIGIANPDVAEALSHPDHPTLRCWMMNSKTSNHIKVDNNLDLESIGHTVKPKRARKK